MGRGTITTAIAGESSTRMGTDGIGMVHYADTGKQDLLLSALGYLTKPDEQILATPPSRSPNLCRMEISVARPRGEATERELWNWGYSVGQLIQPSRNLGFRLH